MKIRNGFVSNSSSTSFTCDSCGSEDGGMNACLDDVYMVECLAGHILCENHVNFESGDRYEFPSDECPCCNLETIYEGTVNAYTRYLTGRTREDIVEEIRSKFNTDEEVWKEIRGENT